MDTDQLAKRLANGAGIVVLEEPHSDDGRSQARLGGRLDATQLLDELGVSAGELLGVDGLVIVEGLGDEAFLRTVFPTLMSRLRIVQSGGVKQALKYCETLSGLGAWFDWLCLIDRDLMGEREVRTLEARHPQLFVWRGRDLETLFLSGSLISAAYQASTKVVSEEDAEEELRRSADTLRNEVVALLTRERALEGARGAESGDAPKGRRWLEAQSGIYQRAADSFERLRCEVEAEIAEKWDASWRELVDPKLLLPQVVQRFGEFSRQTPIDSFIIQALAKDVTLWPQELLDLKARLEEVVRRNR